MRRTKIVCTMGPNEDNEELLLRLAKTMDVARFNFSHGSHEEHSIRLAKVRAAAKKAGRPIAMMLDTKGPEIRTGLLSNHASVILQEGEIFVLTTEEIEGTSKGVSVSYKDLPKDVSVGDTVLIDDGLIGMTVEKVEGNQISCVIKNGGILGERKGINLPDTRTNLPELTEQDKKDIAFAIENDFDYIAASFIRDKEGVLAIRKMLDDAKSPIKIISKIECKSAIDHFEEILEASDGIMVARGDLGVEVDPKTVPQLQKEMIQGANYQGKPVITATQMLDSMIRNPRPTRAEVTDVATAVNDGTDAVMLSGETANGKYPAEALEMMASIAEYTEQFQEYNLFRYRDMSQNIYESISNTTCRSTVTAAHELKARAILAPTITGSTALLLSKYRPDVPVYALSSNQTTLRQMSLLWGITPISMEVQLEEHTLFEKSVEKMVSLKVLQRGDLVVVTAGLNNQKFNRPLASTNTMRIMEV